VVVVCLIFAGREQILKVHMRKVPLSDNVDPPSILRAERLGFRVPTSPTSSNEAGALCGRVPSKRLVEMSSSTRQKTKS